MTVVEVSGRTVDDAVEKALDQLDLNRDQVDVDVISEGKRGLLGIGSEEAVVRVTAKADAVSAAPAASGRDSGGGGGGRRRGRRGRGGAGTSRERGDSRDGDAPRDEAQRAPSDSSTSADEPEREADDRDDGDGGRNRSRSAAARSDEKPSAASSDDDEDPVDFAGRTLRQILTMLELNETQISARAPETPGDGEGMVEHVFDIYGDDEDAADELGVLIGRRGDTLRSLQYLLNTIVRNRFEGTHVFGVDIEEYRARRERSLIEMAQQVAEEVRATGDVITLEPMRAADRRIVHITLREEEGVVTESIGEGSERQVEVMPE